MKLNANAAAVALGLAVLLSACGGTDPAPSTGPDLVMQGVTVNPVETAPGGTVEVEFTIVNAGDETAATSTTRISINQSGDSVAGGTQLRDLETAAITPGSSLTLSGPVTLPELEAGDYFLWLTADVNQEAGQSDRSNDSRAADITITTVGSTAACTDSSQVIDMPDANLAGRVRVSLGISESTEILCQDLQGLTTLSAVNSNISNLDGLQHAINLSELDLARNEIADLSPLAGLLEMESLNLGTNEISSIAPLANLTELTLLGLGKNVISSIAALANLTKLEHLEITGNPVGNLAPVAGMTSLQILYADSAGVTDLSALEDLQGLQELGLMNNNVSDLTSLAGLTNLWLLLLDNNEISDLTPLANLGNVLILGLAGNRISSLDTLEDLARLESLQLDRNEISDLGPVESLTALTYLSVGQNGLADLEPLRDLSELSYLNLDGNLIVDLAPLEGLLRLSGLHLAENQISDIGPLVANIGLGSGDSIYLRVNCLDLAEGTPARADLDTLVARGAFVVSMPQRECGAPVRAAGRLRPVRWLGPEGTTDADG